MRPLSWHLKRRVIPDAREAGTRVHVILFRVARSFTQAEAAKWWGVSVRQWRRYESGETRVPAPLLKRIAKAG